MGNEDKLEMQTKDYERKYHQNCESYRDILVKDLERVSKRRDRRWRMRTLKSRQNEEVEFIHCSPASSFIMRPHEDDHEQ